MSEPVDPEGDDDIRPWTRTPLDKIGWTLGEMEAEIIHAESRYETITGITWVEIDLAALVGWRTLLTAAADEMEAAGMEQSERVSGAEFLAALAADPRVAGWKVVIVAALADGKPHETSGLRRSLGGAGDDLMPYSAAMGLLVRDGLIVHEIGAPDRVRLIL